MNTHLILIVIHFQCYSDTITFMLNYYGNRVNQSYFKALQSIRHAHTYKALCLFLQIKQLLLPQTRLLHPYLSLL